MSAKFKNYQNSNRFGDIGLTDSIKSKGIKKTDPKIKAIAAIDEITSLLGLIKIRLKKNLFAKAAIEKIQNNFFDVSAWIAGINHSKKIMAETALIENTIEDLSKKLPRIKKFIIPGTNETETLFHLARAKTRIAEIAVWETKNFKIAAIYLNRVSDYLFLLAIKSL